MNNKKISLPRTPAEWLEAGMNFIFFLCGILAVGCVLLISVYMVLSGVPAIQEIGLFRFLFGTRWASTAADPAYGILPFILSSVYGTLGATVIGVPIGLLTAVFLSKAAGPKLRTVVVTAIELLSGIPSVVFGLLGMQVLVPAVAKTFGKASGACLLSAIVVLAVMILPSIVSVSVTALNAVPPEYEQGSLALGATDVETWFKVSVPAARSGIAAGIVLGIGMAVDANVVIFERFNEEVRAGRSLKVALKTGFHNALSAIIDANVTTIIAAIVLMIFGTGSVQGFAKTLLLGAAAQLGTFVTLVLAGLFFDLPDAASIAVIGAADGPTAIFVANVLHSQYLGAIMVAAYSYMALVPIVQPPVIKLLTTQKERRIRMPYQKGSVSQLTKILFPIVVTIIAGLVAPASVALVGFLMFGNLLRECGVLNALSETAQNVLANLITIVLGLTVAGQMTADKFVRPDTLLIMALGLVAFIFDTAGGVLFAKLLNLFLPEGKKLNPMIGAAGISAFPMSGRVVNKMGLEEDNQNFLLMYSISVNVSGQIASVLAGGLILSLMA